MTNLKYLQILKSQKFKSIFIFKKKNSYMNKIINIICNIQVFHSFFKNDSLLSYICYSCFFKAFEKLLIKNSILTSGNYFQINFLIRFYNPFNYSVFKLENQFWILMVFYSKKNNFH